MRALVTGCAGFIGSHLTDSLLAGGHQVVGIDLFSDNYPRSLKLRNLAAALDHPDFRLIRADLAEAPLEPLLDGCDAVFHLAAEAGVQPSFGPRFAEYARSNVRATERLVAAARTGVRHVLASSSSVYGEQDAFPTPESAPLRPRSPYAGTKVEAERAWRKLGPDGVILRLFTVFGPRQRPDMAFSRFCAAAREGGTIELYGTRSRDFTYVADVVRALRLAGERPDAGGAVLNVGSGRGVSLARAVEVLAGLAGRPVAVREAPEWRGDVRATLADATAALAVLGWRAETGFAEGLEAQWAWSSAPAAELAEALGS